MGADHRPAGPRAVIVISSRASDTPPAIEDHLAMMGTAIVPGLS
jgi:hypothetical protein